MDTRLGKRGREHVRFPLVQLFPESRLRNCFNTSSVVVCGGVNYFNLQLLGNNNIPEFAGFHHHRLTLSKQEILERHCYASIDLISIIPTAQPTPLFPQLHRYPTTQNLPRHNLLVGDSYDPVASAPKHD